LSLKEDYAPAHYLLAVAYDQLGKADLAIAKLEETKRIVSQDFGIAFQLGLLYWRKGEVDKAKGEFERVLSLNPNYQNAKYMLGLVLDKKGEKEKAKEIFEELLSKNPENREIKRILENLRKGLPALEGIKVSQPPLQEFPPEVSK
jgi:tetratricopeptide (TPR) repeat protein